MKPACLTKLFLNEKFILTLIILNGFTIMIAAFSDIPKDITELSLIMDNIITAAFILEMGIKLKVWGYKMYFGSSWNILDFVLIVISIPAFVSFIFNLSLSGLSFFLIFRILRVFKSFRFIKFVPGMTDLIKGVRRALKTSMVIILGFSIYLFIIGILSCYIFRNVDPQHFGDPLKSFYTIFGVFTMEGWIDVPAIITQNTKPIFGLLTRLYFVFIVVTGGIFGLSLVNSIFVEAMLSDNTDDIQKKVDEIDRKLDELISKKNNNAPEQ
jgi:voltage-gated sodium channel